MKRLILLALTISSAAFAQQTIVKKDGTKLNVTDISVRNPSHQIEFKVAGKTDKIAYSELDSAIIDKKILKRFDIGKKAKIYYVLASYKGKTLGVTSSKRNRERGGFSSVATLYETVVIENGKLLQELKFTESKTTDEVDKRLEFFNMANRYFGNCPSLLQKLSMFSDDKEHLVLLNYLDNPEITTCR